MGAPRGVPGLNNVEGGVLEWEGWGRGNDQLKRGVGPVDLSPPDIVLCVGLHVQYGGSPVCTRKQLVQTQLAHCRTCALGKEKKHSLSKEISGTFCRPLDTGVTILLLQHPTILALCRQLSI